MKQLFRRNNLKYFFLILGLSLTGLVAQALSSDSSLPAKISADKALYDHINHLSIYEGHVDINQGTTRLQGDEVKIYNQETNHKITELVAVGRPAIYSTLPDNQTKYLFAQANRIEFYPLQHRVLLLGNGKITDNKNSFAGPRIEYFINKQTISSMSSNKQQTKIVIQPQNN